MNTGVQAAITATIWSTRIKIACFGFCGTYLIAKNATPITSRTSQIWKRCAAAPSSASRRGTPTIAKEMSIAAKAPSDSAIGITALGRLKRTLSDSMRFNLTTIRRKGRRRCERRHGRRARPWEDPAPADGSRRRHRRRPSADLQRAHERNGGRLRVGLTGCRRRLRSATAFWRPGSRNARCAWTVPPTPGAASLLPAAGSLES